MAEGARQLWAGKLPPAAVIAAAAGGVAVQPGNTVMRRNQDLPISAQVLGNAGNVQLHVRFENSDEWEVAPMDRDPSGSYAFTLYAVRDGAHYYVTAGRFKSAEHQIQVVDLPSIEKLQLTYDYPNWTGLAQRVEDGGADIRAVAGTSVGREIVTSAPLEGPLLVMMAMARNWRSPARPAAASWRWRPTATTGLPRVSSAKWWRSRPTT
jgi:hypothetical protein